MRYTPLLFANTYTLDPRTADISVIINCYDRNRDVSPC